MVGGIEGVRRALGDELGGREETFGACVVGVEDGKEGEENATIVMRQSGIFRTNCKGEPKFSAPTFLSRAS